MLVSSRPEPEWDEDEREKMLALQRWQDGLCPRCGGPAEKCQSPEAESQWAAGAPTRCHVTTAVLRGRDEYMAGPHSPHPDALIWTAQRQSTLANTNVGPSRPSSR